MVDLLLDKQFQYLISSILHPLGSISFIHSMAFLKPKCIPFCLQEAAENLRLSDSTPDEQLPADRKPVAEAGFVKQKDDESVNANRMNTDTEDGTNKDGNRSDSPVSWPFFLSSSSWINFLFPIFSFRFG